ncbi:MAG: benzoylsuccinyl-CoA thiolase [Actinobacteria bacterium]|nr:MAG: benzoylsuccinyl-CoA thiolase [Actinomycetota bacterium]
MPAPAVEGFFTTDPEPALLGTRCSDCGTYHFPAETFFCRNPACSGTTLEQVTLSSRGTVWSWTMNRYAAPPPFPQTEAFEPYGVAAVELAEERMIVLGMLTGDFETLKIGDEVELLVEPHVDGETLIWKWKPVA